MKKQEKTAKVVCPECGEENPIENIMCSVCDYDFRESDEPEETDPFEKEEVKAKELCFLCEIVDIEEPNLYAEFKHEELGQGKICRECFDKLPNEQKIEAKILKEHLQDKAHDEEFMESIVEKPLTPEQAAKKKKDLTIRLESLKKSFERYTTIGDLANNEGLMMLLNDVKEGCHTEIDNEDPKEAKNVIKNLESVLLFRKLIASHKVEAKRMKSEIEDIENQLVKLGAVQIGLFDVPENQDLVNEVSEEAKEKDAA